MFTDPDAVALLQINQHDGATYFQKEQWEGLVNALHVAAAADDIADDTKGIAAFVAQATHQREVADALIAEAERAGYQVETLLGEEPVTAATTVTTDETPMAK